MAGKSVWLEKLRFIFGFSNVSEKSFENEEDTKIAVYEKLLYIYDSSWSFEEDCLPKLKLKQLHKWITILGIGHFAPKQADMFSGKSVRLVVSLLEKLEEKFNIQKLRARALTFDRNKFKVANTNKQQDNIVPYFGKENDVTPMFHSPDEKVMEMSMRRSDDNRIPKGREIPRTPSKPQQVAVSMDQTPSNSVNEKSPSFISLSPVIPALQNSLRDKQYVTIVEEAVDVTDMYQKRKVNKTEEFQITSAIKKAKKGKTKRNQPDIQNIGVDAKSDASLQTKTLKREQNVDKLNKSNNKQAVVNDDSSGDVHLWDVSVKDVFTEKFKISKCKVPAWKKPLQDPRISQSDSASDTQYMDSPMFADESNENTRNGTSHKSKYDPVTMTVGQKRKIPVGKEEEVHYDVVEQVSHKSEGAVPKVKKSRKLVCVSEDNDTDEQPQVCDTEVQKGKKISIQLKDQPQPHSIHNGTSRRKKLVRSKTFVVLKSVEGDNAPKQDPTKLLEIVDDKKELYPRSRRNCVVVNYCETTPGKASPCLESLSRRVHSKISIATAEPKTSPPLPRKQKTIEEETKSKRSDQTDSGVKSPNGRRGNKKYTETNESDVTQIAKVFKKKGEKKPTRGDAIDNSADARDSPINTMVNKEETLQAKPNHKKAAQKLVSCNISSDQKAESHTEESKVPFTKAQASRGLKKAPMAEIQFKIMTDVENTPPVEKSKKQNGKKIASKNSDIPITANTEPIILKKRETLRKSHRNKQKANTNSTGNPLKMPIAQLAPTDMDLNSGKNIVSTKFTQADAKFKRVSRKPSTKPVTSHQLLDSDTDFPPIEFLHNVAGRKCETITYQKPVTSGKKPRHCILPKKVGEAKVARSKVPSTLINEPVETDAIEESTNSKQGDRHAS